jgi:hypothetical protein
MLPHSLGESRGLLHTFRQGTTAHRNDLVRQICGTINFSQVFAGQTVDIKEVQNDIWLVSFMDYDLGYFNLETRVLEPLKNPFGAKLLPMS